MTRSPATAFIVRVWDDGESTSSMRGEIEHVRTGEKHLFANYSDMLSVIEAWRQDPVSSR